jgi:uncharacterized zinc-type alcohol dehydrogenase-like protein
MPTSVLGYAAHASDADLKPFERRDLRPDYVDIDVLFYEICHSDVRNDWGGKTYPIVPGHEIISRITRVRPAIGRFAAGQVVGVGCLVDSCRVCSSFEHDQEYYCLHGSTLTYAGKDRHGGSPTYGGYSDRIVVPDRFVLSVPEGLDLAGAPPCCAPRSPPTRR